MYIWEIAGGLVYGRVCTVGEGEGGLDVCERM